VDRPELFKILNKEYASLLSKDPSLREYMNVCGAKYFNALAPLESGAIQAFHSLLD
jgi:hypothetical protein